METKSAIKAIELRFTHPEAEVLYELEQATVGSAGMDLRAMLSEPLKLLPGDCVKVSSGVSIWIQDPSLVGYVYPRSGLGHKHGIVLGNGVGVIDSDYTGEILLSLWNRSQNEYTISPGERVAQLVIQPIFKTNFTRVSEFSAQTARGSGGFGHTGQT